MQQFKTLLLREWMQHRRSWLILGLWSPVVVWALVYLVLLNGGIPQLNDAEQPYTIKIASMVINMQSSFVFFLALIGVLLTIPGLPYRDKDDKSLAFWRSLPIDERAAVVAPALMNGLLLPLMAIVSAIALNLLLSAPLWVENLNAELAKNLALTFVGASLQSLLTLLWFSPLVLLLALGNSVIRRWGMALVLIGGLLLQILLIQQTNHAPASKFVDIYFSGLFGVMEHQLLDFLGAGNINLPEQMTTLTRFVANPAFAIALTVSALCLAALICRRKTGQSA
jgi:ABC-2 type transport system permease protein